jgi:mxaJ protein
VRGAPTAGVRLATLLVLALPAAGCARAEADPALELRVCADPNNLPFSNARGEGFENRLAELVAEEMGARVTYTWWAQRRGFVRNTLRAGRCDVLMGIPSSFELARVTRPYYRSTYVFVHRADAPFEVRSFDDAVLRELRIGVHVVGDDYANTPPVHALASRGFSQNLVGYSLYADYSRENPPARLLDALADGEVDVAIAWGPMAGYFARRLPVEVTVVPVSPQIDPPFLPMVFDISVGVRHADAELALEIDEILTRRAADVERILDEYGVPRVGRAGAPPPVGGGGR